MTKKSWIVTAFAGAMFAMAAFAWQGVPKEVAAAPLRVQASETWEYGFLENLGGNAGYSFTVGDQVLGRNGTSIDNLIRLVDRGWRGLPTAPTLWNALGSQGWEFAWNESDGQTGRWVFKRRL